MALNVAGLSGSGAALNEHVAARADGGNCMSISGGDDDSDINWDESALILTPGGYPELTAHSVVLGAVRRRGWTESDAKTVWRTAQLLVRHAADVTYAPFFLRLHHRIRGDVQIDVWVDAPDTPAGLTEELREFAAQTPQVIHWDSNRIADLDPLTVELFATSPWWGPAGPRGTLLSVTLTPSCR